MKTYYIKQKVFSFRDSFSVFNDQEEEVYRVKSKLLSFNNQLAIMDLNDTPLMHIKQKMTFLKPTYLIEQNGGTIAEVTKRFAFFKTTFDLKPHDWTLTGDFMARDYTLKNDQEVLMEVRKKWLSWGDSYELRIADDKDVLTYIAVMIVLDMVAHNESGAGVDVGGE